MKLLAKSRLCAFTVNKIRDHDLDNFVKRLRGKLNLRRIKPILLSQEKEYFFYIVNWSVDEC
jgi:hypothetical protein